MLEEKSFYFTSELIQICSSVFTESFLQELPGSCFTKPNLSPITVDVEKPVMSIRPKLTWKSFLNRMLVEPLGADFLATGSTPVYYAYTLNPALTGGAWTQEKEIVQK